MYVLRWIHTTLQVVALCLTMRTGYRYNAFQYTESWRLNWEINIRASHYLRIWLSSYDNVQTFLTYGTSDRYGVCRRSKLSRSRSNCSTAFSFMLHVIGLTSWCLLPNKHNVLAQTDTTLQCTQSAFAIMPPKCHRSCWRRHAAQYLLKTLLYIISQILMAANITYW